MSEPPRAYLFADPAAHSLSPVMHAAAFAAAGLSGGYEAVRVPPHGLAAALDSLRAPGVLGANLSLPHKEAALPLLDELTPAARQIGAVNTVVNRGGRLTGDNTDAPGLGAALADLRFGVPDRGGPLVVLGAGGAARAAVHELLRYDADVYIYNRTLEHARRLAAARSSPGADVRVIAARRHDIPWSEVGLIVNASSAGLSDPDTTPLPDLPTLRPGALVYDMVYRPAVTRLTREARAAGYRAENGLGMLAHQARLSFSLWTGADLDVAVFLTAARRALGRLA